MRNDLNKYVYQKDIRQQHYLSFSGGSNNLSYNLSTGYTHNVINLKNSKADQQYTINANANFRPINNLEIQTGISYSQGINKSMPFLLPNSMAPYQQLANSEGEALTVPSGIRTSYLDTAGIGKLLDWRYRPLDEIRLTDNTRANRNINLNFSLKYRFNDWLNLDVAYRHLAQLNSGRNYKSQDTYYTRNLINHLYNPDPNINPDLKYPVPLGGILDLTNAQSFGNNIRATLNFNQNFGKHQLNGMIAAERSEAKGSSNRSTLYGYNDFTGNYKNNLDFYNYYPICVFRGKWPPHSGAKWPIN